MGIKLARDLAIPYNNIEEKKEREEAGNINLNSLFDENGEIISISRANHHLATDVLDTISDLYLKS